MQEKLYKNFMPNKLAINQRVRELMAALGYSDNVDGFYKKYFGEGRSEKLRTVVKDLNPIKTDFLVEIADKIAQTDGRKVNGHWLLTGIGEMFISEEDPDFKKVLISTQRRLLRVYEAKIAELERELAQLRATNYGQ
jgi:hypothetical protein